MLVMKKLIGCCGPRAPPWPPPPGAAPPPPRCPPPPPWPKVAVAASADSASAIPIVNLRIEPLLVDNVPQVVRVAAHESTTSGMNCFRRRGGSSFGTDNGGN